MLQDSFSVREQCQNCQENIWDCGDCFTRKPYGRGFQYLKGTEIISCVQTKRRLKALKVPPNWEQVRICESSDCKIQSVGFDAKGRKQYLYHDYWVQAQQQQKFENLKRFGEKLSRFREFCIHRMASKRFDLEWSASLAVLVLDTTGIRVGNRRYYEDNNTCGLTTLRRKHLTVDDDELNFEFVGKHGQSRSVNIDSTELVEAIETSAELPGYEIFRYRSGGRWQTLDSDDLNHFIQERLDPEFSAKYFRTWAACRLAIEKHNEALDVCAQNKRKQYESTLISLVSEELGHTPAICKKYYVSEKLLDYLKRLSAPIEITRDNRLQSALSSSEQLLLEVLRGE